MSEYLGRGAGIRPPRTKKRKETRSLHLLLRVLLPFRSYVPRFRSLTVDVDVENEKDNGRMID